MFQAANQNEETRGTDPQYVEQLQALTNSDEHLEFIKTLLEKNFVTDSEKQQLLQQIDKIKKRSLDPNFYLAIVGEFSSGKSTFINALLRDDLLKTSALVATASATKIRYGDDLIIEAKLAGAIKSTIKTEKITKKITLPHLNINRVTPRELIHILTTQAEIAENVVSLTLNHPASFLQEKIVIIDTPGTNAINDKHGEVTRKTIANEADAAVVIIPATTPLSQSLANFLDTSLRPFLHRCIFVITKMDSIRKKEREQLLNNIKNRLETMLGIEDPLIRSVSAQTIIDNLDNQEDGEESISDSEYWSDNFTQLEEFLLKKLRQERILIIAENNLSLLTKLLEQLATNLTQEWQKYQERHLAIKNDTIQDITSFAQTNKNLSKQTIIQGTINAIETLKSLILEYKEKKKQKIRQSIFSINSWEQLKDFTENKLENLLESEQEILQNIIENRFQFLNNQAKKAQSNFDYEFTQAYKKLQALGASFKYSHQINQGNLSSNISNICAEMKAISGQQEEQATGRVITGAVIGVVGAILIPGIGAIIGGIIGASLSRWLGPSLDDRKKELWDKLEPNLNDYFKELITQTGNNLISHSQELINSLNKYIDLYTNKYNSIVQLMLSEQEQELERLNNLQLSTQAYLKEIERRKLQMKQQQERLKNIVRG